MDFRGMDQNVVDICSSYLLMFWSNAMNFCFIVSIVKYRCVMEDHTSSIEPTLFHVGCEDHTSSTKLALFLAGCEDHRNSSLPLVMDTDLDNSKHVPEVLKLHSRQRFG